MRKRWTKEEEEFLIKNYPKKGGKWCAKKLSKTLISIRGKAVGLKLKVNIKSVDVEIVKYKISQISENKWIGFCNCPECDKERKYEVTKRFYLIRNIKIAISGKRLCSSCNKKGDKNPFAGKAHSVETKILQSKNRKGKACGEENSMANPKHRKKVSDALKKKYASGDLDFLKKIQSENAIKNQANGKLKTAPISKAEIELKEIFERKGFTVVSQFKIGSFPFDLYIKELNATIEYNGDYWHCNPTKYNRDYLHEKKNLYAHQIWEKDKRKKELSEVNNHNHFIIWENDYKFNKEKEINKIINGK